MNQNRHHTSRSGDGDESTCLSGVAKDLLWAPFGLTVGLVSATCGLTVWLWVQRYCCWVMDHTAQEDPAKCNPPG